MNAKPKYSIYKMEGDEVIFLQESSVRFSRANRAALKAKREGHRNVFFAHNPSATHHSPLSSQQLVHRVRVARKLSEVQPVPDEMIDAFRATQACARSAMIENSPKCANPSCFKPLQQRGEARGVIGKKYFHPEKQGEFCDEKCYRDAATMSEKRNNVRADAVEVVL